MAFDYQLQINRSFTTFKRRMLCLLLAQILIYMQKILVVLGRFGDIYMTLRQMKDPCILACYPDFAQIVTELFPQHSVYQLPKTVDKKGAVKLCKMKFPDAIVMSAQQHGCKLEEYIEFRNYQSYQVFYANKLQESNHIS